MKLKQKSALEQVAVPAPVRTGEIVPATGRWQSECSREGCRALFPLVLHHGAPAPCCPRCCNHTTWVILYTLAPWTAASTQEAAPAPTGVPPLGHASTGMTESAHSARGAAAAEASARIRKEKQPVETPASATPFVEAPLPFFDSVILTPPPKEESLAETTTPAPDEKKKIEAPPAEPSLIEKLTGKAGRKKV